MYKADDLAEGYFDADDFSNDMKKKFAEYARLVDAKDISDEERIKRAELRCQLKNALSKFPEGEARDMFDRTNSVTNPSLLLLKGGWYGIVKICRN